MITPMTMQDGLNSFLEKEVASRHLLKTIDRNGVESLRNPQIIRSGWVLPKSIDEDNKDEEEFPYIMTRIDKIENVKVSSIDPIKCTAQVTFEDRDDIVSGDLFVTVPYTLKDKAYYMPAVGERVRVLFDPEAPSKGCILGSYYADTRLLPFGDENKTYIFFEDGTLIEYDKKLHTLTVNIPKVGDKSIDVVTSSDITVKSDGNVRVESAKEIEITCVANMTITTNANLKINADADITMKSAANITVESAANMEIKAGGTMLVESAGAMTLKGATIDIN